MTEIVVEETAAPSATYDDFAAKMPKNDCRYAVFDCPYKESDGSDRSKLIFIVWCPDTAKIKAKMVYAASKDALRKKLVGVASEIQATDAEELEYDELVKKLQMSNPCWKSMQNMLWLKSSAQMPIRISTIWRTSCLTKHCSLKVACLKTLPLM